MIIRLERSLRAPVLRIGVLAIAIIASGCAGTSDAASEPTVSTEPTGTTERTGTIEQIEEPVTTAEPAPSPDDETAGAGSVESDTADETGDATPCTRLTEFETQAELDAWLVVNDDVMGGRSAGAAAFADSVMTFAGTINTDGGGFASLRLPIVEGTLSGVESIRMRVRSDGRSYKLTMRDSLDGRDNRTSHQAPIPSSATGEWDVVEVSLADLEANVFGRSVETEPFVPELANRIGLMMSDGIDGDFAIDVDWIDLCGR